MCPCVTSQSSSDFFIVNLHSHYSQCLNPIGHLYRPIATGIRLNAGDTEWRSHEKKILCILNYYVFLAIRARAHRKRAPVTHLVKKKTRYLLNFQTIFLSTTLQLNFFTPKYFLSKSVCQSKLTHFKLKLFFI